MKFMRVIPLVCALVAGALGYMAGGGQYLVYLLPLAIINVLVLAGDRMDQVRGRDGINDANPLFEGVFLFIVQVLILGFAYLLGFLLARGVPLLSL